MRDLSVLIPARNEMWLRHTVDDVLRNLRADTEIIVIADGQLPLEPLKQHPRVQFVYLPTAIGQRAATNLAARISTARYIMKLDAHCAVDEGFDAKLIAAAAELGEDVTQVPAQYNLHVFDWVCSACQYRSYQGPTPSECPKCQQRGTAQRELVWNAIRRRTEAWRFDKTLHFQYWGEWANRHKHEEFTDVMCCLGACWFLSRERYWTLDGLDEQHGSWGQMGVELACKSWLSGGRMVCTKRTWFSHMFRTQGGDFSFPFPLSGREVSAAREHSRKLWVGDAWPKAVHPLSWLIDKFAPVPDWHDAASSEAVKRVADERLVPAHSKPVARRAKPGRAPAASELVRAAGQAMPAGAGCFSAVGEADSARDVDVIAVGDELQVRRVAAPLDLAPVVHDEPVDSRATERDRRDQPRVHQPVHEDHDAVASSEAGLSVSGRQSLAAPEPAAGVRVHRDLREEPGERLSVQVPNGEKLADSHASASSADVGSGAALRSQRDVAPSSPAILSRHQTAGVVYYSDCRPEPSILEASRRSIEASGMPIVAVTLQPIRWPAARNIVLPLERGYLAMFKQILAGLEALDTDVVFFAEHDVVYSLSHFAFRPPRRDTFYYNQHVWKVDADSGRALHYVCNQTSGLCADRQLLIAHYRKRVSHVEQHGFSRRNGFEPGTRKVRHGGFCDTPVGTWMSEVPNVDIRHGANLTPSRWSRDAFRNQKYTEGWTESDHVPGWPGVIKGRFSEWVAECF